MTSRIDVVHTGGTLGMVRSADGLVPGTRGDLVNALRGVVEGRGPDVEVHVEALAPLIDSANATPLTWQTCVDTVRHVAAAHSTEGVVLVHGTDTLAHTAAALSLALTGIDVPVVITGAQRSIHEPDSDAPGNLEAALRAVIDPRSAGIGVCVAIDGLLMAGPRVVKVATSDPHAFESPGRPPLARLVGHRWQWAPARPTPVGWPDPLPYRPAEVLVIPFFPGLTTARLHAMTTPRPDGVILVGYGTGQGPGHQPGMVEELRDLVGSGVPVAVVTRCLRGRVDLERYEAAEFLREAGVVPLADATVEAAHAKMVFLLSQELQADEVAAWMARDIAGEMTIAAVGGDEEAPAGIGEGRH